ncbi:MAG: hypothetical protein WAW96_15615, partial [Alphaproteobacteria bacterium]
MKRNAKSRGSGGRLRLTLLLATAAAFLLVPVASASAAHPIIVEFAGTGSGWVKGSGVQVGAPPIECHWNGAEIDVGMKGAEKKAGVCESETIPGEIEGFLGEETPDEKSEFGGWKVLEGINVGCEEFGTKCGVITFGSPVKIKATFNPEPKKYKLTLSTSGSGPGSFKCNTGSGEEECKAEYVEGTKVTVTPKAATGSKFEKWTGDCSGTGACEVTMSAEHSVGAEFNLIPQSFSTTVEGEGKVECEDNGGGLGPCAASYLYGHTIKVVATATVGNKLKEISGTGSASGCSASPCSFEIKAASSIKAVFKSEKVEDKKTANVEGEVPQTTTLESTCGTVKLGEFKPGVPADYYNACGLTLTTTGEKTTLTASDGSALHTGHLVQEYGPNHLGPNSYFLPSPLDMAAHDSEAKGTSTGVKQLETPAILLEFDKPVSKDATTLEFNQHIGEHDGLHT